MLKLERASRGQEIHISFRPKATLLTPDMRFALLVALGIHLIGGLLFHVGPFKFKSSETILPPTFVESLIPTANEPNVTAQLAENTPSYHHHLAPQKAVPVLPDLPKERLSAQREFVKESRLLVNPFAQLEQLNLDMLEIDSPSASSAYLVNISGPLADMPLLEQAKETMQAEPPAMSQIFSVQVDNAKGIVVWYEPHELHPFMKQVLEGLRFQPDEQHFMTTGTIEVVLNP